MTTPEIVTFALSSAGGIVGLFITIESRQEKRAKALKDSIAEMIDSKIGEYANKVNSERMQQLERENDRLREYARELK